MKNRSSIYPVAVDVDPRVFRSLRKGFLVFSLASLLLWIKVIEASMLGVRKSLQHVSTSALFILGLALFLFSTWLFIIPSVGSLRKAGRGFTPIYRLLIIGFFVGAILSLLISPFLYSLIDLGLTRLFVFSVTINVSILYSGFTALTLLCLEVAETFGERRFVIIAPLFLIPLLHIAASITASILFGKISVKIGKD